MKVKRADKTTTKMKTIRKHLNMVYRRHRSRVPVDFSLNNEYERVYLPGIMSELVAALQRKDDVLHVISLRDYFLLPPASIYEVNSTKKASPPRISIILPAHSPADNSTFVRLMRIDCEVFDTSLIHIAKRLINNLPAPNQLVH